VNCWTRGPSIFFTTFSFRTTQQANHYLNNPTASSMMMVSKENSV
jgi:hypothetical protein